MPGSLRCSTTQSMAEMTCDTSVLPCASATLRLMIREFGAMPLYACGLSAGFPVYGSWPAMTPAMNVPWPKVSR